MNAKMIVVLGLATGWASSCKKEGTKEEESPPPKEEVADLLKKRPKSAETQEELKLISNGAKAYYRRAKRLPESAPITPPLGECCENGGKCVPMDQWTGGAWAALDFAMLDPHYYSYEFTVSDDGASYTALAYGDLDCDGEYSTYSLRGEVVDGEVRVVGDVQGVNPEE